MGIEQTLSDQEGFHQPTHHLQRPCRHQVRFSRVTENTEIAQCIQRGAMQIIVTAASQHDVFLPSDCFVGMSTALNNSKYVNSKHE